jgi:hypothetical protein
MVILFRFTGCHVPEKDRYTRLTRMADTVKAHCITGILIGNPHDCQGRQVLSGKTGETGNDFWIVTGLLGCKSCCTFSSIISCQGSGTHNSPTESAVRYDFCSLIAKTLPARCCDRVLVGPGCVFSFGLRVESRKL